MMDLLIQVTTSHHISPAGHIIHVVSDARPLAYKPSTPIGTLDATILEIVPKNRINDHKSDSNNSLGEACQRLKAQEWIYKQQLVVNLPRQQLAVYRVPPHTRLADVLTMVCADKDISSADVRLRRPEKPDEDLDASLTLHDLDLHEVSLVPLSYAPPPLSVSDLLTMSSLAHQQPDLPAKRKSVFRLFSRKNKSRPSATRAPPLSSVPQSTGDSSLSSGSAGERSASPTR
ncbi:protein cordon-bleu [Hyalella azteca]|uniref:Protein cordon-bleu n=1 Tax=Hyalella azteca TaxID=294128 RepID=A0A979FNF8_HYAAZ|nr:protein cordon-bleu [Hyalella azteca]